MTAVVTCRCGFRKELPDEYLGKALICPKCKGMLFASAAPSAPPAAVLPVDEPNPAALPVARPYVAAPYVAAPPVAAPNVAPQGPPTADQFAFLTAPTSSRPGSSQSARPAATQSARPAAAQPASTPPGPPFAPQVVIPAIVQNDQQPFIANDPSQPKSSLASKIRERERQKMITMLAIGGVLGLGIFSKVVTWAVKDHKETEARRLYEQAYASNEKTTSPTRVSPTKGSSNSKGEWKTIVDTDADFAFAGPADGLAEPRKVSQGSDGDRNNWTYSWSFVTETGGVMSVSADVLESRPGDSIRTLRREGLSAVVTNTESARARGRAQEVKYGTWNSLPDARFSVENAEFESAPGEKRTMHFWIVARDHRLYRFIYVGADATPINSPLGKRQYAEFKRLCDSVEMK